MHQIMDEKTKLTTTKVDRFKKATCFFTSLRILTRPKANHRKNDVMTTLFCPIRCSFSCRQGYKVARFKIPNKY